MSRKLRTHRTQTYKGKMAFEEKVEDFQGRLCKLEQTLEEINTESESLDSKSSLKTIRHLEENFSKFYESYQTTVNSFEEFISSSRVEQSAIELRKCKETKLKVAEISQEFYTRIDSIRQAILESLAKRSAHSDPTLRKADAQRMQLEFANREAELNKKRAILEQQAAVEAAEISRRRTELEADQTLLLEQKHIVEAESSETTSGSVGIPSIKNVPKQSGVARAAEFELAQNSKSVGPRMPMNPAAPTFIPSTSTNNESLLRQCSNFLIKTELLLSRFSQFDDRPVNYQTWKGTFKSIVKELEVSDFEELDLLVKWLGQQSSKQAKSIRAANAKNPTDALARVWDRLDERYGSPELVEQEIKKKLASFPKLGPKDNKLLYDLYDIVSEIESLKEDPRYETMLSFYDSSVGVSPIVSKLPYSLMERWSSQASKYKVTHEVAYPPFTFFANFLHTQCRMKNDPSFFYEGTLATSTPASRSTKMFVKTNMTNVLSESKADKIEPNSTKKCPIHKSSHHLSECREFLSKSHDEKVKLLKEFKLCFKCMSSVNHVGKNCPENISCDKCGKKHSTAMHMTSCSPGQQVKGQAFQVNGRESHVYGGERQERQSNTVLSCKCTDIDGCNGASCAKIVLVDISVDSNSDQKLRTYAVIDDQSNCSLARPELFDKLGVYTQERQYTINSCTGSTVASGRLATNCIIESVEGSVSYKIPNLIECTEIPNNKQEICTPHQARQFPHLSKLAIPEVDDNADILILIGRDVIDAHHILEQVTGQVGTPFAQRIGLGWVVIGELCLETMHSQFVVNVNKTNCLPHGRPSLFKPCTSKFSVDIPKDQDYPYDPVFVRHADDNILSMSVDDREFLQMMDTSFSKNDSGEWVAPLPFKSPRLKLPNNRSQALRRAQLLDMSLRKNETKKQHCVEFMSKVIANGHAEIAPVLDLCEECWYLPLFGVYNSKKPDQIRLVFDSSAECDSLSLNAVLLTGPDLVNSLVGVLTRFRSDQVAIMADIEQMFYSFSVLKSHRNFLRFFWYEGNDPKQKLIEYRMCKHVFGNSPSPAIATYGLRRSVADSDSDVQTFVNRDFYVDDGITSVSSAEKAIDLLLRTKSDLGLHGLRLHKISSNNKNVMRAFPEVDLAKNLKGIDFDKGELPQQRSLGVCWNLDSDSFGFTVDASDIRPTRRGILSTVNSIFDPLGFLAPVTIEGKLILRDVTATGVSWDDLVSSELMQRWNGWLGSLQSLKQVKIPRPYFDGKNLSDMSSVELHVFSDASEKAIASVVYVVGVSNSERIVSFVSGKAKVAPVCCHTIPRLELCAAVLAAEMLDTVKKQLDVDISAVRLYSDSRVVLGYINNTSRRFYTFVANRVQRIRQSSTPSQWKYVASQSNPADVGTRGVRPDRLSESIWFSGPPFLQKQDEASFDVAEAYPLQSPEKESDIRPVVVKVTQLESDPKGVPSPGLGHSRFERFSSWSRLVVALCVLCHIVRSFPQKSVCHGWHICEKSKTVELKQKVEKFIVKEVQNEVYKQEISMLENHQALDKSSSILNLNPFLDSEGILRVGGRLSKARMNDKEKHPILLPGKHHVSKLLVSHFHESVKHQGRLLSEAAIRSAGFWITGAKRLVTTLIYNCVTCRKLRGKMQIQKMADLPFDRIQKATPFSYVGVDVFGPWSVVSRRTRGGQASSKRWAVLFTCLTIRAVHIEVVEEMSSSAFINALRRFIAIRGNVKQFRSDRGTNFVGATGDLGVNAINVEDEHTKKFLFDSGSVWYFNPPHSSHMGGAWERMIGIARRILDSTLADVKSLTQDVLVTVMSEACAIINSRPIVPVSTDCSDPEILSPAALLTMKFCNDELPSADVDIKDMYKSQWKQVRFLADRFWYKWRKEYLQTLQPRRK